MTPISRKLNERISDATKVVATLNELNSKCTKFVKKYSIDKWVQSSMEYLRGISAQQLVEYIRSDNGELGSLQIKNKSEMKD